MIERLQGFKPGEKVWVLGRSNEFLEALIAPLARQAAYQAKPDYSAGQIIIMRKATGVIGSPVWFEFVFHDTAAFRAFRASIAARSRAQKAAQAVCEQEGFVWGGKAAMATPQWRAYEAAEAAYNAARKVAAAEQPNAG
jgi:hypothetical protein